MKYVIDSKTYEKHIRDEVHLYGLLHQLAFLAGKVKDEEDMANLVETSKHYGEIAEKKFDDWLIPGRYLAFGDRDDLAELKAAELTPLTAVLKEHDAKIREKQRAASSNDPAYIISGSAFRMLVGDLFDLLAQYGYGVSSNTSVGCMEKVRFPGLVGSIGGSGIESNITNPIQQEPQIPSTSYQPSAYTSVDGMERKDGSIGTLKIPSLNINMKVWEGETNTSMAKGLGHYSSTSGWDGNIGVCGHNRGAKYTIGNIKNLKDGDTITYTTVYGTRTYEVVTVETIASSDWSYLQATSDNRITITTCLANQPSKRVCVQAVEVK